MTLSSPKIFCRITCFALVTMGVISSQPVLAQVVNDDSSSGNGQSSQSSSSNNNGGSNGGGGQILGQDVPFFDPGSEVVTWDGRSWNINDNRIFRARFEKYLNAPEAAAEEDKAYRDLVDQILKTLAPTRAQGPDVDLAFQLLPQASNYTIDANLCDSLANAIFNVWMAQRQQRRLTMANEALREESGRLSGNAAVILEKRGTSSPTSGRDRALEQWAQNEQMAREMRIMDHTKRIAEIEALRAANAAKREVSEIQAKIQFQGLILQFYMQRRFQHVLMASRFYSLIFGQGDQVMDIEDDSGAQKIFMEGIGMPPTIGMLESMANEAIRDVDEGVDAFEYLLEKEELRSASERLGEAFLVGEYLPKIRTLERDKKRQVLGFTQRANQLVSALEVKDFTLAEELVDEMREIAKDFDPSKPLAGIETARSISSMHLAKAKNAAVAGDHQTVEAELRAATEIWPRNPALSEVSSLIFTQSDTQNQALVDLDHLITQKNYRQVFDDQLRFIAATATDADRRSQLQVILQNMQKIEAAIMRAQEMAKRGDYRGAWESVEKSHEEFPADTKLNQIRADLTTRAADFVGILQTARQMEERGQLGAALGWYLKAQNIYPPSDYAREGIHRLSEEILPDSSRASSSTGGSTGNTESAPGSILSLNR